MRDPVADSSKQSGNNRLIFICEGAWMHIPFSLMLRISLNSITEPCELPLKLA
jgi:hypothetical protein